jgi:hypothetical protein
MVFGFHFTYVLSWLTFKNNLWQVCGRVHLSMPEPPLLKQYHDSLRTKKFQGMKSNDVREFVEDNWDTEGMDSVDLTDKNQSVRTLTYILRLLDVEQSKIVRLSPLEQLAEVAEHLYRFDRFVRHEVEPEQGCDEFGLRDLLEVDEVTVGRRDVDSRLAAREFEVEVACRQACFVEPPEPDDEFVGVDGQAQLQAYVV